MKKDHLGLSLVIGFSVTINKTGKEQNEEKKFETLFFNKAFMQYKIKVKILTKINLHENSIFLLFIFPF